MAVTDRNFTKVMEISNQLDIDNCESITGWTAGTDTASIAASATHKTGQYSISFAKSGTTGKTGTIYKTIGGADGKHANIFAIHKSKLNIYVSSVTNLSSITLKLGTSSSHCNNYTATSISVGWNELEFENDSPTTVTGNGCNWYGITYVAVVLTWANTSDVLTGILIDTIYLYKTNNSGASAGDVNIDEVGGAHVPTDDSAMPATPKMLAVGGEYRSSATTYTDGDATVLQTNVNGELKVAISSDIEIGAVEIKNGASDDRALVSDANTARAATDHVLQVQQLAADGTVPPSGSLLTNAVFTKLTDGTSNLTLGTGTTKTVPAELNDGTTKIVFGTGTTKNIPVGLNDGTTAITFGTGTVKTVPVQINDGTTGVVVETDGTKKALNVNITDGTNDMPTMDAVGRPGYVKITDGTDSADLTASTPFFDNDGDNTAQTLKASPGNLKQIIGYNANGYMTYIQIFNKLIGSVTPGTTTPDFVVPIQPSSATVLDFGESGLGFSVGIAYCCTTTTTGAVDPTTGIVISACYL